MVTSDFAETRCQWLLAADVGEWLRKNERGLRGRLIKGTPSASHVSSLLQSLAWHERRQTPSLRLAELRRVLGLLIERTGDDDERALYVDILACIDPTGDEKDWRTETVEKLDVSDKQGRWAEALDFMIATAVVGLVQQCLRAERARRDVDQAANSGGGA
jgi:hypothetical protein